MGTPVNQSGRPITNVRYPSGNDDAANKQYVDDSVAAGSTVALALAQGTITAAVPVIGATTTWNAGGVTFTGWKLNVTNTASAAASLLMDLQVGGNSKFSVVAVNGWLGIGTATPAVAVDAYGWGLLVGADSTSATTVTRTDATAKQTTIVSPHYTNAEEPVGLIGAINDTSQNNIYIGSFNNSCNGVQTITFLTSANKTTLGGTQQAFISANGLIVGNTGTSLGRLHVLENAALTGAAYPNIYGSVIWQNAGTAHIGWQLNVTDTSSAAASTLLDLKIGANSVFQVRKDGSPLILGNTAVPAGGSTGAGLRMSTTSNLGVFFGSGAPTLNAAQGSLYMRTDGSSTSTRLYVNTNGTNGWTNVTTAT